MGSATLKQSDKTYNAEINLWVDSDGVLYVKNEFNPGNPVWIDVSRDVWEVEYKGVKYKIEWNKVGLSVSFLTPFREVLKMKLRENSPRYIGIINYTLISIGHHLGVSCKSVGALGLREISELWEDLLPTYRSLFREFYAVMAQKKIDGASHAIATAMKSWKARSNIKYLRDVLEWNEIKGALTNAEAEVVRKKLQKPLAETCPDVYHAGRLITWIMFETLKRGLQVTSLIDDDLKEILDKESGVTEWMLDIPMVKGQAGRGKQWWPISPALVQAIMDFWSRPSIVRLRKRYKNLVLWNTVDLERGGISSSSVRNAVNSYINQLELKSPRTNKKLSLTPTRIRHTGATLLAKNGVSRDVIQTILEHDSPCSANAYIDACGSELIPAIDRVNRATNTFSELNDIFFKGKIGDTVGKNAILIPVYVEGQQPAIAGDCGKKTYCSLNPFYACYDNCSHFIAWREADHERALMFVRQQQKQWERAEGKERTSAPKNFERLEKAIMEVIQKIAKDASMEAISE